MFAAQTDVPFFFGNPNYNVGTTLPPQALPQSKKTEDWERNVLDTLQYIALKQFRENIKFTDVYDMLAGRLVYTDLVDVPPQLKQIEGYMSDVNLPTYLKHYDLIGLIIKTLVSHYSKNADKFVADSDDDFALNEYQRRKQELMNAWLKEEIDKEIELRLIEQGMNPFKDDFQSEEEKQQYMQAIQERKTQMTPPEIDRYMRTDFTTNFVRWANLTLEQDAERYRFSKLDRQNLTDLLATGRTFRHLRIGYDFYEPERWSPINTFFSQDLDVQNIEDCDYVGRLHYYTPSQVVDLYGSQLKEADIKKLLNGNSKDIYGSTGRGSTYQNAFEQNGYDNSLVPHRDYYDYNFMLQMQDYTGTPMGEATIVGKDGNEVKVDRFLPHRMSSGTYFPNLILAQQMRKDIVIRRDLVQVLEAYWKGYIRVGQLTYQTPETGRIDTATVTEDLLSEFIQENGIKKLTSISIEEYDKLPIEEKVNTVCYTYVPVIYEGIKISMFDKDSDNNIYLKCKPMDLQLKGNSNIYDCKLPVAGIIDECLANILRPFQIQYNYAMNQVQNLSEKELGILFFFDIKMLPAELKNFGDGLDDVLNNLVNMARRTGFFPMDSARENIQASGRDLPMTAQNLSLAPQIQNCFEIAERFKQAAFEQVGITPQMLGAPTKYETSTGVQVSQDATYAQIERYYDAYGEFKKSYLDIHLNGAQYCKKNNKDITIFYSDSDRNKVLLQFTDDDFWLKKINIQTVTNAKKRRELETFKQFIINTNTLGDDTLALAEFITSDTTQQVLDIARQSIQRRQQQEEAAHQRQMEQIQAQAQMTDAINQKQWERDEVSHNRDRLVKIQVAEIDKAGKESNTNFQKDLFNSTHAINSLNQKQEQLQAQNNLQQQEIDRKKQNDLNEKDYREQALEIKKRDQELREQAIKAKTFGDIVNKN